jgi:hypothetical protein
MLTFLTFVPEGPQRDLRDACILHGSLVTFLGLPRISIACRRRGTAERLVSGREISTIP